MASSSKPTVRDIARHAGVSVATVSRVTSDDPHVTPGTRTRVLASIEALGYRPSALGRGLANGRFSMLGIVLPGLGGPYFAELIQGAESVAGDAGMALSVIGTHMRRDVGQSVQQLSERTDGLVVVGGTVDDTLLHQLAAHGPLVVVADSVPDMVCIRTDGHGATRELTAHLVEVHGYRTLRFVGKGRGSPDAAARYAGFREALAERGLAEVAPPLVQGMDSKAGAGAARELVASGAVPHALVCANDELAIGLLATLPGLGVAVPGDVAIVGFDDNALASLASPTLTTIHQPIQAIGAEAARVVLDDVRRRKEVYSPPPPEDRVIQTRLVIRESCGCLY